MVDSVREYRWKHLLLPSGSSQASEIVSQGKQEDKDEVEVNSCKGETWHRSSGTSCTLLRKTCKLII